MRLAMLDKTLASLVLRVRRGQLATLGKNLRPVTEVEVSQLKHDLVEA